MSIYSPPTFSEYLPVFNPANWVPDTADGGLDINYLNANYAKYPSIQGTTYTVQSLSIDGALTLNEPNVERIILPLKTTEPDNGTENNLVISNENNLAGCGLNANQNIVIGRVALGAFSGNATNAFTKSTIIGHSALGTSFCTFANEGITAIGSQSLNSISNTVSANDSAYNTAIGYRGLKSLQSGASNTGIGYKSGEGDGGVTSIELVTGDNNTFIGARTGLDGGLVNLSVNHSTAIGADAVITGSNQVVLGSLNDTVIIGNSLTFQNTSTTQKSASDNYTTYSYSTTLSLVDEVLVNTLVSLNPSAGGLFVNIPDTANVVFNALSRFSVANISNFQTTLRLVNSAGNPSATSTFTGLYGSQANTILLQPKSQFNVFINSTGLATFVVQDRMPEVIGFTTAYSGTDISLTSPQYFDSTITLTGTVATLIFLPDPRSSVNSFSGNRSITLINEGSGLLTINSTNGNFGGNHGNSATTIFLPDNAFYTFTSNGTIWEINQRSQDITYQNLNVNLASAVSYAGNYNYLGATLNISSTVAGTIIYPIPSDSQAHLTTSIIRNIGSYTITVSISSGAFAGKYGKTAVSTTHPIPPNSWIKIFSDGTNYRIDERSAVFTSITMSSNSLDISTQNYYTDCRLGVSPFSDSSVLTISNPTTVGSQTYNIFNEGQNYLLTIRCTGFNFATSAKYSNNSSISNDLTIPPNSWVKLYSDGSVWKVIDKSSDNQIYNYSPAVSFSQNGNLLNNATANITPSTSGVVYTLVNPTGDFCEGVYQIIYNKSSTNSFSLAVTGGSVFQGKFGSSTTSLTIPTNSWVKLISNGVYWLVEDRSTNFNFFINPSPTTLDIASNLQYLDSDITFTPPTNPLNTSAVITATVQVSAISLVNSSYGYIATVTNVSAPNEKITAGSVLSYNDFDTNLIIRCQLSGTLGGNGTYLITFYGSTNGPFTAKIKPTGMTLSTGTYSQDANQTTFYNGADFVTGTPTAGMTVSQANAFTSPAVVGTLPSVPFFVINQRSGTTWNVTMGTTTSFSTAVTYFATSSQQVLIPQPSGSNSGRTITIINISYNPINITTSTGTNVFGGKYAQVISDNFTTPNGVCDDGVSHLLRAGDTLIIKSNGTIWDTQEGTSFSGSRTFTNNTITNTNATDRTKTQITLYPLDQTFSNLTCFCISSAGSFYYLGNMQKYTITVNITATVVWSAGNVTTQTTIPIRLLYIDQGTMDTKGTSLSVVNSSPVSCALTSGTFVPTAGVTTQQSVTGTFTLKAGDYVILQNAKINGAGTESFISVTLSAVRVG